MKSFFSWFMLVLLTISAAAQNRDDTYKEFYTKEFLRSKYPQKMPVLFRAYPVYLGNDQYRVYLPVEMKHEFLQFVRSGEQFVTNVEIEVIIKDHETEDPVYVIWKDSARTDDYYETVSRSQFHSTFDTVTLAAGQYEILFRYTDFNNARKITFKERLTLPKIEKIYTFPLLFVYPGRPNKKDFPMVKGTPSPLMNFWDFNRDLGVFLQVWQENASKPIPLRIELMDQDLDKKVFVQENVLAREENRQYVQVKIPKEVLKEGRYQLTVLYKLGENTERQIWPFELIWFNKPLSLWDFDLSIEPLQYLLDDNDYKILRKGNKKDQIKKFSAYWKEKDPTPETPYNELQTEFYSRVDSTLFRFSERRTLGWKTDLGKVFILNGPPNAVNDHSLDPIPDPYMQWIYHREGTKVVFTFRALDGRKEYKLAGVEETTL
jgi:GWxTD domain-containing protein